MTDRGFKVRGLGEVAIRCRDLDAMTAFYRDVIGLEPLTGNSFDQIRFFKIADGVAGHTTVLALFATEGPPTPGPTSSLHHIALSLPFADQETAIAWYDAQGVDYTIQHFDWIGWRGVFTKDPEGNTVELVAFDPDLDPAKA